MNSPNPTASDIDRLRHASDWVQQLHESSDDEIVDRWLRWCDADPRNLAAFDQMQRTWNGFPAPTAGATRLQPAATHPGTRGRVVALAASIVLLAGFAAWLTLRHADVQALDTPIGEQRRITLADGSQLDLAPGSRVSTSFTLMRRDVRLERGQAFFAVAHSALRPFVVHVSGLTVTAQGTAFDVRIGPSSTVVTVSEGRVEVTPGADQAAASGGTGTEPVRAASGQQVTFSRSARRLSVATVDPKVAESWRAGALQFLGESLEDVVGELNRYSERQIVVASAFQQTPVYRHRLPQKRW